MALEKVGLRLEAEDWRGFVRALSSASGAVGQFQKALQALKRMAAISDIAKGIFELTKAQEFLLEAAKRRMVVLKGERQLREQMAAQMATQAQAARTQAKAALEASIAQVKAQVKAEEEIIQAQIAQENRRIKLRQEAARRQIDYATAVAKAEERIAQQRTAAAEKEKKAAEETDEFGNALMKLAQKGQMLPGVLGKISGGVASLGKMFTAGSLGAVALGTALGVGLIVGLNAALKVISKVISKVKELTVTFAKAAASLIEKAATTGGRFNEMELAAVAVGRGIGLADEAIIGAIKSVNAMNIRYDVAAAAVMRMARVQIDLKYATDLVRIAQAIAVETGTESSEQVDAITHALTTNNTQMLRRHGIFVDDEIANRRFADANDLAVESLTRRQKIEATIQEVIRQSTHLLGVYEAAMRSGAKIMRSIESRQIPELVAALGGPMQGAFSEVTQSVYDFLEALTKSITEGGRFYPTMVKIGAVLQIVGEHLSDLVGGFTEFLKIPDRIRSDFSGLEQFIFNPEDYAAVNQNLDETGKRMNDSFSDMAVAAFEWGAEIMAQFARGLAAGLRFVGEAMLLIATVLGDWLAPGSPPKIAPDIAKWGAAAMAEYLRGFGMVDFGAFEGIQKVLGRLLSGPGLASLLGEVIEAMSTGTVGKDLFARISAAAGAYGAEIVKLTKLQFAYADALRAVEAAQLALNRAQAAVKDHSLEVDKLVHEYNELLRAGASDEILDTRLDEINMSERARNMAIVERDEAQVAIKLAEERLEPIKEALALQEKLVDVLLDLAAAQADVVEETKKAASGAAEAILEEFKNLGAGIGGEFKSAMQTAIDAIKDDIAARLKGIFQPVWDAWFGKPEWVMTPWGVDQPTGQMVGGVVQAFEGVTDAFGPLSESLDSFVAMVEEKSLAEALEDLPEPFGSMAAALNAIPWPTIVEAIDYMADALKWVRENWGTISKVLEVLTSVLSGPAFAGLRAGREVREEIQGPLDELTGKAQTDIAGVGGLARTLWQGALNLGKNFVAGLFEGAEPTQQQSNAYALEYIKIVSGSFGAQSAATKLYPLGRDITAGIAFGMGEDYAPVLGAMEAIAKEMLAQAQLDSGTELEKTVIKVGAAFTRLIAKGIKDNVWRIVAALRRAMEEAQKLISEGVWWAGPGAPPPPGGGGGGGGGGSAQQGGYSPRGGTHHPGEYVIPAGLTRALMSPVSHTSNFTVNNNVSSQIDVTHMNAMVRNMVRGEIARAH